MSSARKLKGKAFGISPDCPKEILERRKKKMQQFKKAKEDGKTAYFSWPEPQWGGGGGTPRNSWYAHPGSPNPDPISDQNIPFSTPVFRPGL